MQQQDQQDHAQRRAERPQRSSTRLRSGSRLRRRSGRSPPSRAGCSTRRRRSRCEGVTPRPTVYVGPRLLVSNRSTSPERSDVLRGVARTASAGPWTSEQRGPAHGEACASGCARSAVVRRLRPGAIAPDGWTLLQQARAQYGVEPLRGVGLDHVVFSAPVESESLRIPAIPYPTLRTRSTSSDPSHARATRRVYRSAPTRCPARAVASRSRTSGPRPRRRPTASSPGGGRWWRSSTPGAATHPWLDGVVDGGRDPRRRARSATPTPTTDPEIVGDLSRAARRVHRPAVGPRHLHRGPGPPGLPRRRHPRLAGRALRGPDRRVRPGRGAGADRRAGATGDRRGEAGGRPIDVLSLSMGYYHETPEDVLFDPTMYEILRGPRRGRRRRGLLGGQRRDRPPDRSRRPSRRGATARDRCTPQPDCVPIVSVGALNPNGTDALFTNAGPWVRAYAARRRGDEHHAAASRAGCEPMARTEAFGRARESIDPDDYRGGFARLERHVVRRAALRRAARGRAGRAAAGRGARRRPAADGRGPRAWPSVEDRPRASRHDERSAVGRGPPPTGRAAANARALRSAAARLLDRARGRRATTPTCGADRRSACAYVERRDRRPEEALRAVREALARDGLTAEHPRPVAVSQRGAAAHAARATTRRTARLRPRAIGCSATRPRIVGRAHLNRGSLHLQRGDAARPRADFAGRRVTASARLAPMRARPRPSTTSATPACCAGTWSTRCRRWTRPEPSSRRSRRCTAPRSSRTAPRC